jgi:hypothetical protein
MNSFQAENIADKVINIPSAKTVWYDINSNVKKAYPLVVDAKTGIYHHVLLFLEGYDETKFDEYISRFASKYGENLNAIKNAEDEVIFPK